jgi:hypothetical protein
LPSTMQPFLSQLSGLIVQARGYCVRRHSWAFFPLNFPTLCPPGTGAAGPIWSGLM